MDIEQVSVKALHEQLFALLYVLIVQTLSKNALGQFSEKDSTQISDMAFKFSQLKFTCTRHFNQFHNKNILHYLAGHFGNSINGRNYFLVKSDFGFLIVSVVDSKDDLFVFLYGLGAPQNPLVDSMDLSTFWTNGICESIQILRI